MFLHTNPIVQGAYCSFDITHLKHSTIAGHGCRIHRTSMGAGRSWGSCDRSLQLCGGWSNRWTSGAAQTLDEFGKFITRSRQCVCLLQHWHLLGAIGQWSSLGSRWNRKCFEDPCWCMKHGEAWVSTTFTHQVAWLRISSLDLSYGHQTKLRVHYM